MTESINSTIEKWLTSLEKSPNTRRMHRHAINVFTSWLDTHATGAGLESLNLALLMDYVEFLQKERRDPPLGHTTIRSYIGVVVRWLQWLVDQHYIDGIQSEEGRVAPRAVRDRLHEIIIDKDTTSGESEKSMPNLQRLGAYYEIQRQQHLAHFGSEPNDRNPKARRDYLNIMRNRSLVAFLFSTDIWVSDVLTLMVQSIMIRGQIAPQAVIKARGGEHTIYLNDLSRLWMAEYLAAREEWYSDSVDVFISHGPKAAGKRMSVRSVERVIKEAGAWLADQRAREGADPKEIAVLRELAPNTIRRFVLQTMAETIVRPRIELDLSDALAASQ